MRVLIVGASKKPERYANMAMKRLLAAGHEVVLFNPTIAEIDGIPVLGSLRGVGPGIDTVTLYVGPERLEPLIGDILACAPRRIVANPGAESLSMRNRAEKAGIEYKEACTLVMLSAGQF